LDEARLRRADWLVFEEKRMQRRSPEFFKELEDAVRAGEALTLARVEPGHGEPGRRVLVYAYKPAP
jgi:hypothetical protein